MIETQNPSDEILVASFLETGRRDERLFSQLFRRRHRLVWNVCYKFFGNTQDADDTTQEVFFQAFRKLHQFRGDSSFRTWLQRIAENSCKNELRHRSRRLRTTPVAEFVLENVIDPGRDSLQDLVAARSHQDLQRALSELTPEEVTLLQLVANHLSTAEVAERLGISVSAAKMRVLRARLRLRSALELQTKKEPSHE